jgi:hypothetical protein
VFGPFLVFVFGFIRVGRSERDSGTQPRRDIECLADATTERWGDATTIVIRVRDAKESSVAKVSPYHTNSNHWPFRESCCFLIVLAASGCNQPRSSYARRVRRLLAGSRPNHALDSAQWPPRRLHGSKVAIAGGQIRGAAEDRDMSSLAGVQYVMPAGRVESTS